MVALWRLQTLMETTSSAVSHLIHRHLFPLGALRRMKYIDFDVLLVFFFFCPFEICVLIQFISTAHCPAEGDLLCRQGLYIYVCICIYTYIEKKKRTMESQRHPTNGQCFDLNMRWFSENSCLLVHLLYILKSSPSFVTEPVFFFFSLFFFSLMFLLLLFSCCRGKKNIYRRCLKLTDLFETLKGQSVVIF